MLKNALKIKQPLPIKCSSCRLKSCPVFSSLCEAELPEIEKIKQGFLLKKDAVLFSEKVSNLGAYIVQSGLMKIYKSCLRGPDLTFRFAMPGDIMDLASYNNEQNNVSIKGLCETQVCFFEAKTFAALLSRFPSLTFELLSRACRELSQTRNRTLDIAFHPVVQRLAQFLLYWKDAGPGVYLSREEMAQAVGCSLETMIRVVSQLRKKGIIRIKNKELSIADPNALTNFTNGRLNSGWK